MIIIIILVSSSSSTQRGGGAAAAVGTRFVVFSFTGINFYLMIIFSLLWLVPDHLYNFGYLT